MNKTLKNILLAVATVAVLGYLVFALFLTPPGTEKACQKLCINILDEEQRSYVNETELSHLLKKEGLFPTEQLLNNIQTDAIEKAILGHPMVRTAECYKSSDNQIHVDVTQRVPIVHIITEAENYYIDSDRKLMPARASIQTPVLVARGHIGHRMAAEQISDFAEWLHTSSYWKGRIQSVRVAGPKHISLVQSNQQACICLGDWDDYSGKLEKLQAWYTNGKDLDLSIYHEVDVRYKDQVIGKK